MPEIAEAIPRVESEPSKPLNPPSWSNTKTTVADEAGENKPTRLACATCGTIVAHNVARFCWFNKPRFGGNVYCMDCQKAIPKLVNNDG